MKRPILLLTIFCTSLFSFVWLLWSVSPQPVQADLLASQIFPPRMFIDYAENSIKVATVSQTEVVTLTVVDAVGLVKGQTVVTTDIYDNDYLFGYSYQTEPEDWFGNEPPDIHPTDSVMAESVSGVFSVTVGSILGDIDYQTDMVTFTVDADLATVDYGCKMYLYATTPPFPITGTIAADGTETAVCDFSSTYDVVPSDGARVYYQTDNNSYVANQFLVGVPFLNIHKSSYGNPSSGGNIAYKIEYSNWGDLAAQSVLLTDTIPADLVYLTDTAPVNVSVNGDELNWYLPEVAENSTDHFYVFFRVPFTITQGTILTNTAGIQDDGVNVSGFEHTVAQYGVMVDAQDVQLDGFIHSSTQTPALNETFFYTVDTCNLGQTTTDEVSLVFDVDANMVIEDWQADFAGWEKDETASTAQQLVLTYPSFGSSPNFGWCTHVFIAVKITSGTIGADVTGSFELDSPFNNDPVVADATVEIANPFTDLAVYKTWDHGVLAPNQYLHYRIDYENAGNMVVPNVLLTDTLPNDTELLEAYTYEEGVIKPIEIVSHTDSMVVFGVGDLLPGKREQISVKMKILPTASSGNILQNLVQISTLPADVMPANNTSLDTQPVNALGANIRVQGSAYWTNAPTQAEFVATAYNVGTSNIDQFTTVVSIPAPFTVYDVIAPVEWDTSVEGQTVTITGYDLFSGEFEQIRILVEDNTAIARPSAVLSYTFMAEATPLVDEVDLFDNIIESTLYTSGPELEPQLMIHKTAEPCCNELQAGSLITYHITLTNTGTAVAPNVILTDALPIELAFVSATPAETGFDTETNEVYWQAAQPMPPNATVTITLLAEVEPFAAGVSTLDNYVEATATDGVTVWWDDYVDILPVTILTSTVDLTVSKTVSSEFVLPNEQLVYTITVANNGPDMATGIVLVDFLPEGLQVDDVVIPAEFTCFSPNMYPEVVCEADELLPNQELTINIIGTVLDDGFVENFVFVFSNEFDVDEENNWAYVETFAFGGTEPFIFDVYPPYGANTIETTLLIDAVNVDENTRVYLNETLLTSDYLGDGVLSAIVPAGLPDDFYDVAVVNVDDSFDLFFDAFVAYTPEVLSFDSIEPPFGFTDEPNIIEIYGAGFLPGMTAHLDLHTPLLHGDGGFDLDALYVVDDSLALAVVPAELPAGMYDLVLKNPTEQGIIRPNAYQIVGEGVGDIATAGHSVFVRPVGGPIVGEEAEVGFRFYRTNGLTLTNVIVDIYDNPPNQGGMLIDSGVIPELVPNGTAVYTTTWTPTNAGLHRLYGVIDPDNLILEVDETNNTDAHPVLVRNPNGQNAPVINTFTINNGTSPVIQSREIICNIDATLLQAHTNIPTGEPAYILYIDHVFDQSVYDWVPIYTAGWLPYDEASTNFHWHLRPQPGAHYVQVWVADEFGNVSERPGEQFMTLARPDGANITHGEAHVYLRPAQVGQTIRVRLTSLSGDADMYLYAPDGEQVAASFATTYSETVMYMAESDGVYHLEIVGAENGRYRLATNLINNAPPPAQAPKEDDSSQAILGHVKGGSTPFFGVGSTPGDTPSLPTVPGLGDYEAYLPIIIRE